MKAKNKEGEQTDQRSRQREQTGWMYKQSGDSDRETERGRLSAPASTLSVMSPWSSGTHVENPGMMQPSKSRSITLPACSHGANYDVQ